MKKVFTLLTLLVAMATSAWANQTELISGVTLPDIPSSTLNLSNQTDYTANAYGWIVETSPKANIGSKEWHSKLATDGGEAEWTVPAGCAAPFINSTSSAKLSRYTVRSGARTHAIRFTGAEKASFLVSRNSDTRKTVVAVYSYVGTTQTLIESKSMASGSIGELLFDGLTSSTTYIAYIYGTDASNNSDWYEFALKAPSAPAKAYTVTAATNNSNYGTAAAAASSLDAGETTTITATPETGYKFVSWAVEGTGATLSSTTTNPTTLTMGTANATVTATFSAINYTITHNDATGGTYTISVAGGDATSSNTTATIGQTITLAGTPTDPAHTYVAWNVKDAGDNDVTVTNNEFTMPASNVTIAPVFSEPVVLNILFSMTAITGPTATVASQTKADVTATFSTGASAEVFNGHGSNAATFVQASTMNLNSSGASYLHITIPTLLKAGDVISFGDLTGAIKVGVQTNNNKAKTKTFPYTITASDTELIGSQELYFFKDGSATFTSVTVEGQGTISDLAVTSSATPTVAMGATSNITYTSSSTGAVTYASDDESVATVSNTGVITGVDGGTATITITQDADETYRAGVAKVTVTVPAIAWFKIKTLGGSSTKVTGTMDNVATGVTADVDLSSNRKMDKTKYVGFTLNGVNALQTGDIIKVEITEEGQGGAFIFYDSKGDNPTVLYNTGVAASEAKVYSFVVPASMNGVKTVYLRRGADKSGINEGFNPFFGSIAVYRPDVALLETATSYTPVAASDVTVSLIRTLSKDYWNTFCVPFDIDLTKEENNPLYGAEVQTFDEVDGTTLKFKAVTTIEAGNPYIVKPTVTLVNPVFEGVDVQAAPAGLIELPIEGTPKFGFQSTYNQVTLLTDKTNQFLNTSGNFSYPDTDAKATMKGLRAYFIIPASVIGTGGGSAPEISISFDGDEEDVADDNTTVIDGIEYKTVKGGEFYNLNGQRVAQPTKGLYIMNGKKYVVK